MSMTVRIIIDVLLGIGALFALAGTLGIIRMPDALTRMQASTCIATLGLLPVVLAGIIYGIATNNYPAAAKILLIGVIYIIANPAGSHAIARACHRRGNETVEMVCDDLKPELDRAKKEGEDQ